MAEGNALEKDSCELLTARTHSSAQRVGEGGSAGQPGSPIYPGLNQTQGMPLWLVIFCFIWVLLSLALTTADLPWPQASLSITNSPSSLKLMSIESVMPSSHLILCRTVLLPPIPPASAAKSLQSCPTLCDPIDGSPPGSPVPGILQARILEWVAISFSNA